MLRHAFCLDGYREHAAVEVRQDEDGLVSCRSFGATDAEAVRAQVARVLSLDVDAEQFSAIGERDPVIGELQSVARGLRPPLFYSPYEAAVWAIISARRSHQQAARIRDRVAETYGRSFDLAGSALAALPLPERLLEVDEISGLPVDRIPRLHAVARAALAGDLDVARLRELGPQQAMVDVQRLPGIGPLLRGAHRGAGVRIRRRPARGRAAAAGCGGATLRPGPTRPAGGVARDRGALGTAADLVRGADPGGGGPGGAGVGVLGVNPDLSLILALTR